MTPVQALAELIAPLNIINDQTTTSACSTARTTCSAPHTWRAGDLVPSIRSILLSKNRPSTGVSDYPNILAHKGFNYFDQPQSKVGKLECGIFKKSAEDSINQSAAMRSVDNRSLDGPLLCSHAASPYSQLSDQCITANRAFDHISRKTHEVHDALVSIRYEGPYLIQAGFNEKLMTLGQYEQEIYLFLESNISSAAYTILGNIFHPFPGVIHTPNKRKHVPTSETQSKDLQQILRSCATGDPQAGESSGSGVQSGVSDGKNESGGGGGSGSDQDKGNGADRGNGNSAGEGGGPKKPADQSSTSDSGDPSSKKGHRVLNIPFSSTLGIKWEQGKPPIKFIIISSVKIEVQENHNGIIDPSQPGIEWSGHWFSINMEILKASTDHVLPNESRDSEFALDLAQVLVTLSPHQKCAILYSAPPTTPFRESNKKTKDEKTKSGGGQAILGLHPSMRMLASASHTSGIEYLQREWAIREHYIYYGENRPINGNKDGMLWKYIHNDNAKAFPPVMAQDFNGVVATPSVRYGIGKLENLPTLGIEVVMHWSLPSATRTSKLARFFKKGTSSIRAKEESSGPPPAFTNFLHHASICVDPQKLPDKKLHVPDAQSYDEQALGGLNHFDPIKVLAQSGGTSSSTHEVSFQRAIQGRIEPLTRAEKIGALLLSSGVLSSSSSQAAVIPPAGSTSASLIAQDSGLSRLQSSIRAASSIFTKGRHMKDKSR